MSGAYVGAPPASPPSSLVVVEVELTGGSARGAKSVSPEGTAEAKLEMLVVNAAPLPGPSSISAAPPVSKPGAELPSAAITVPQFGHRSAPSATSVPQFEQVVGTGRDATSEAGDGGVVSGERGAASRRWQAPVGGSERGDRLGLGLVDVDLDVRCRGALGEAGERTGRDHGRL